MHKDIYLEEKDILQVIQFSISFCEVYNLIMMPICKNHKT